MSKTKQEEKSRLANKLRIDTASDNEIIDELIERIEEHKAEIKIEPIVVEEVAPVVNKLHPVVRYHNKGRSINQLAGMFMISEAEVKRIIDENV
jgi:hypothetical protein